MVEIQESSSLPPGNRAVGPVPRRVHRRWKTTSDLKARSPRVLFDTGCASLAGTRYGHLNQDDVHIQQVLQPEELTRVKGQQCYVAAVCDGHGLLGEFAARSACRAVLRVLCFGPLQTCTIGSLGTEVMSGALRQAFNKGHKAACRVYDNPPIKYNYPVRRHTREWVLEHDPDLGEVVYNTKGTKERVLECGTTCTVALAQGEHIWLANVGDSSAVLGKMSRTGDGYDAEELSTRHSCENPLEAARLALRSRNSCSPTGGVCVPRGDRWQGESVAMTRALGHRLLERHGVLPEPHICSVQRQPEDMCLIVASDGVWDALSPATAVQFVNDMLVAGATAQEAAKALTQKAVDVQMCMWGVADNTSAAVISFVPASSPRHTPIC